MLSIKKYSENEIIINKSRFITSIFRIDNIENINNYIKEIKKNTKMLLIIVMHI